MFHATIIPSPEAGNRPVGEVALRSFWETHNEALGHAAALIAGQRGTRLVGEIREALAQPGPATRRLCRHLVELRDLLFLENLQDEPFEETALFDRLSPSDPIVPEICLLADGLNAVLQEAGLRGVADLHLA